MPTPTPGTNSYGSLSGVAAYARVYTTSGAFSATTNPSDQTVVNWIDQLSETVNAALGAYGFVTPITNTRAKNILVSVVEQLAGDLAQAANSAGRFFTDKALQSGVSPWVAVQKNIYDWAKMYAGGLEQLGASRNVVANETQIGFRGSGPNGQSVFPIFQRDGFGNSFQDWETQQNTAQWPDVPSNPNG